MKKKIFLLMLTLFFAANTVYAQGAGLIPGWYYDSDGSPRYYYANGVYYDPATQSYGGMVLYPGADGPQTTSAIFVPEVLTPGVPDTGMGVVAKAWIALIISAAAAVGGVRYLSRAKIIS